MLGLLVVVNVINMECQSPIVIRKSIYKNIRGKVMDSRKSGFIQVPCGKCYACLDRYISEWVYRLQLEQKTSSYCFFVTLTYDDEHLPTAGVNRNHIKNFIRRLRYANPQEDVRYYLISEYGPNGFRPHYHAIFFNVPASSFTACWDKGFVTVTEPICERMRYVASYHVLKNSFVPEGQIPNFKISSNFIGLEAFKLYELDNAYNNEFCFAINDDGFRVPLARYFRKKEGYKMPDDKYKFADLNYDLLNEQDSKRFNLEKLDHNHDVKLRTKMYLKRKMLSKKV